MKAPLLTVQGFGAGFSVAEHPGWLSADPYLRISLLLISRSALSIAKCDLLDLGPQVCDRRAYNGLSVDESVTKRR